MLANDLPTRSCCNRVLSRPSPPACAASVRLLAQLARAAGHAAPMRRRLWRCSGEMQDRHSGSTAWGGPHAFAALVSPEPCQPTCNSPPHRHFTLSFPRQPSAPKLWRVRGTLRCAATGALVHESRASSISMCSSWHLCALLSLPFHISGTLQTRIMCCDGARGACSPWCGGAASAQAT